MSYLERTIAKDVTPQLQTLKEEVKELRELVSLQEAQLAWQKRKLDQLMVDEESTIFKRMVHLDTLDGLPSPEVIKDHPNIVHEGDVAKDNRAIERLNEGDRRKAMWELSFKWQYGVDYDVVAEHLTQAPHEVLMAFNVRANTRYIFFWNSVPKEVNRDILSRCEKIIESWIQSLRDKKFEYPEDKMVAIYNEMFFKYTQVYGVRPAKGSSSPSSPSLPLKREHVSKI